MDHRVSKDMISSGMTPSGKKSQADLGKTQYGSAPSPNRLMDAYHSMYHNQKEETLDEKMGDATDFASRNIKGAKGAATPTPPKTPKEQKREKVQDIMNKYGESVDLLAAYRAVYEHHKKDEDGNTIPHEDDVKEGKIPAGLQAYLDKKKGKKKDDDGDEKKDKKDKKDVKEGAGLYANIHAKRKRGGKMRKKGAKGAPSSQDFANAARTAKEDVDMFDAILNHYVSEGYDAEDVIQAMSSLTEEQLQNIDEALPLAIGTALKAVSSIAAKKGIGGVIKTVASKAGSKLGGSAGRKLAYQAADFATKNPMNTMYGAQMASGMVGSAVDKVNPFKNRGGGNQSAPARKTGTVSASADLFDIVKGQLLDEGLSEEEIKDIMLELTPEEIMKEIEESSMSDGSAGGAYQDLGPQGGFRSKEQINRMHNDPKGTEKYGKKLMKRVGQAVRDTGTPTVRKVDESKK